MLLCTVGDLSCCCVQLRTCDAVVHSWGLVLVLCIVEEDLCWCCVQLGTCVIGNICCCYVYLQHRFWFYVVMKIIWGSIISKVSNVKIFF